MNCRREGMQQWRDEWMVEWIKGWVSEWTNERVNGWMNHWIKGSTIQWVNEISESTIQWTNGSTIQWVNKSMNHWSIESMNQGKNESMNLANFIFQKCSVPFRFANFQYKANSLKCTCCFHYCLVHILPTSSSKSVPIPAVFLRYLCETEPTLSLSTVWCAFCQPHLRKVFRTWQVFTIFMWNRALSPARFLPTSSSKSAPGPSFF